MKALNLLALVLIILGTIIAFVPKNTTKKYKLTPAQLLEETRTGTQFLLPDETAEKIIKKDPSIQLIDVRTPAEFEKFNLPGSVNIPLSDILEDKWFETLNQDVKTNIFYSNSTNDANVAWLLLRQLGYQNNYVLQGGLNYWFEVIMNPQKPSGLSPNEELARYEFRKGAGKALGGGDTTVTKSSSPSQNISKEIPKIQVKKKKKGAAGGC